MTVTHPLDMLTGDEITAHGDPARVGSGGRQLPCSRTWCCTNPRRKRSRSWQPGDPIDRRVRVVVVPGPTMDLHEAIVSVTKGEIVDWRDVDDMRPALLITEAFGAI